MPPSSPIGQSVAATEQDSPPQKFLCPISLEIMRDPVIVESGISYDRKSIEQWFRAGNRTCPVSRKRVSTSVMIDNVFLKGEIQEWLEARGQTLASHKQQNAARGDPQKLLEAAMHNPDGALRLLIDFLENHDDPTTLHAAQQICEVAENKGVRAKLMQFGVVHPLVDLLSHSNADVQEAAAAALWNLSVGSETCKHRIAHCGAVKPLVQLLSHTKVQCQCAAAAALGSMASVDKIRDELRESGALEPLTHMLRSTSVVAVETAATAIWEAARNSLQNQIALVAAGAAECLSELLGTCDDYTRGSMAGALLTVALTDEHRQKVLDANALPSLVQRLSNGGIDEVERCAETVMRMVSSRDPTLAMLVVSSGAVPPIVKLLSGKRERTRIVGAKALAALAVTPLNRDTVVLEGAVTPLVDMVKSSHHDTQLAALEAAGAIGQSEVYGEMLAESGMLRNLVSMLHGEDEKMKTAASSALWTLAQTSDANQQRIARTGAFSGLVQLLHSSYTEQRASACGCLAALALNEGNRHHIVEADAIPILVRLLRLKPLQCQERSAFCLALICRNNQKAQKLVNKVQGIENLNVLLDGGTPECKRAAAAALLMLSQKEKTRLQVYRAGAVPPLVAALASASDDTTRELYAETITQLALARQPQNLLIECGAFSHLEPYLHSPNTAVRMAAARAIKAIKGLITH